jgi:hypothetical protein
MPCILRRPSTQMQNMPQTNHGQSKMMIISRKFANILKLQEYIPCYLILLPIAVMLMQQMHIGLGILRAAQHSSVMFECSMAIIWYNILAKKNTRAAQIILF